MTGPTLSAMDMDLTADEYAHLVGVANRIFARFGHGHHSIQAVDMLHEAWSKVARSSSRFESREHFMATAAKAMRQTLISRARARNAQRRGGNLRHTTLSGVAGPGSELGILELDQVLTTLETEDPEAAQVVLLRAFGGLTVLEIASTMNLSKRTVDRKWATAKVHLARALG
jgi:RNA polymerase sigma-70 factor, ECF subfamily